MTLGTGLIIAGIVAGFIAVVTLKDVMSGN